MTVSSTVPRILRLVALLIVVAAIIDPAVTSSRRTRPVISVVASDPARDSALVTQVARALDARYTILRAPLGSAAGTVLVGRRVPHATTSLAAPVFVLTPAQSGPAISLRRIEAPAQALLDARVPVVVTIGLQDVTMPAEVNVELVHGGIIVSRARVRMTRDSMRRVPLAYVPTAEGTAVLTARAWLAGGTDTLRHDVLVDVRASRWSVLFFDRRPSWISTFVRRALERDPRFAVTSRIVTSTNVSRQTGRAPEGLDVIAATSAFDVVVIGAPDALTARDVSGVSALLRTRGASVLVLPDHPAAGPADALLGFGGWRTTTRRIAGTIVSASDARDTDGRDTIARHTDAIRLQGLSIGTPARLTGESRVIAVLRDSTRADDRALPVIWRTPIGLGQLYVSGAFDAWRFRDTSTSTFDVTWRDLVDEAASAHQIPLDVQVTPRLVTPRGLIAISARPRDASSTAPVLVAMRSARAGDSAVLMHVGANSRAGAFVASVRAPHDSGAYEIVAVQGTDTARASMIVSPGVSRDADDNADLLALWSHSRGGRVLQRDSLPALADALDKAVRPVPRITEWHPMRSPWWIVPLALALACEWRIRRRRGLP